MVSFQNEQYGGQATSARTLNRRVTAMLTDHRGKSASRWMRRRRWDLLSGRFPNLSEMRVIDLGGLADAWCDAPLRPRELVVLNVPSWSSRAVSSQDRIGPTTVVRHVAGDACNPPEELLRERFDLVHCNSVIEHVGGHQRRIDLANAIYQLGDHHWVQTPYRYFPIEAHTLFPGLQFLPMGLRARAARRWPVGNMLRFSPDWPQTAERAASLSADAPGRPLRELSPEYAVLGLQSIELLSMTEMQAYFPTSEILHERVLGVTKSLIACQ